MTNLGCYVTVSDPTTGDTLAEGAKAAHSECCLPAKAYLGHVRSLLGRCDRILVPAVRDNALCMRLWGMGDVVRHTFPDAILLESLAGAAIAGRPRTANNRTYRAAAAAQAAHDETMRELQDTLFKEPGAKILIAARPYIAHDPLIGGPVASILAELGAVVFHSGRFDTKAARTNAPFLSPRLGWKAGQEAMGAVAMAQDTMDGILLLKAFPCAQDALVHEVTVRFAGDIPIMQIHLDGMQGEAGLRTRLESFMDIVEARRKRESGQARHHLPPHGQLLYPHRTGTGHAVPGC